MDKIAVIYWSGTGNTEAMANAVAEGIRTGGAEADLFEVESLKEDLGQYKKFAFGCPSMGDEVLEEGSFEPFFSEIEKELSGKKTALFGSYGWGDGQWMRDWEERTEQNGAKLFESGLIINNTPDESGLQECKEFGKRFSAF